MRFRGTGEAFLETVVIIGQLVKLQPEQMQDRRVQIADRHGFVFGPQTDKQTLLSFFRKVQPAGPGWDAIRREAGVPESTVKESGDHMGLATVGWVSGCTVIWSSLFAIGKFLYGEMTMAWILTGIFVVSGIVLLQVIRKLWA